MDISRKVKRIHQSSTVFTWMAHEFTINWVIVTKCRFENFQEASAQTIDCHISPVKMGEECQMTPVKSGTNIKTTNPLLTP